MTKNDIANVIFENVGLPKKDSQEITEIILDIIKRTLINGESIKISNFGVFNVRKKQQRIGKNPKTGEDITIEPRWVVTFHPSHYLKEMVSKT